MVWATVYSIFLFLFPIVSCFYMNCNSFVESVQKNLFTNHKQPRKIHDFSGLKRFRSISAMPENSLYNY